MLPQPIPTKSNAPSNRSASRRHQTKAPSARRHSRGELLQLVASMARELEERAAHRVPRSEPTSATFDHDALGCLRAARHLREVLSIAEGRKSAAYWRRGRGL